VTKEMKSERSGRNERQGEKVEREEERHKW